MGLDSSRITINLDAELKAVEKKKEALQSLLASERISQETFKLLDGRLNRLTSRMRMLKELLEEEEAFTKLNLDEEARILESLLIGLRFRNLSGEIDEEEWKQKNAILNLGLDSLRSMMTQNFERYRRPAQPPKLAQPSINSKSARRRSKNRSRKRIKEPPELEGDYVPDVHCMNPWNPRCRNTDIELSIYYNGQLIPICRRCWGEISEKNIEWSGL